MFSRVRLLLTISIGLLVLAACGDPVPPVEGFTLTVTVVGDGAVTSDPAGIDTAAGTASASFAENAEVTLTAAPTGAATFVNWTGGACDGSADATCVVEMTADTAVTANFTTDEPEGDPLPFSVAVVNTATSDGSVTSDVGGIDCPDTCEGTAPENSQVVLTAAVTTGGFIGWTGGDCDGQTGLTCTITINPDEAIVTATFGDVETLTETVAVTGTVEELVNASSVNATQYPAGHNYQGSSDLDVGYDVTHSTQQWLGLRFDFAQVPAGANVQSATITMTAIAAGSDAVNVTLSGEAVAAPAPFADDANDTASADTSTRANTNGTTATVDWNITDPWTTDPGAVTTPNLASVVKEIVDVDGFSGAVVIFVSPDSELGSTLTRRIDNNEPIEMTVTWTVPAAAPTGN